MEPADIAEIANWNLALLGSVQCASGRKDSGHVATVRSPFRNAKRRVEPSACHVPEGPDT